jgi:carbon-monoxide dehydrogenase medium subunit
MRIRSFDYFAASSLKGAFDKLAQYGSDAKVLAGGTDLVLAMKHKTILPRVVISLHRLKELNFIRDEGPRIRFGAMSTHTDLMSNRIIQDRFPILREAIALIGSWQIRNIATIGGNVCSASPAADSAAPLLALDARLVVADSDGERELPINAFFSGPGQTVLKPNQILKEIIVDSPAGPSSGCYLKLMRKKAVDLSLVGVAFLAEREAGSENLKRVAIGLGGVAPTPIRVLEAEAILTGLSLGEALRKLPQAMKAAVSATRPITDVRASAEYRKAVVEAYVCRAGEKVINSLYNV